jgi:hypothetical protein
MATKNQSCKLCAFWGNVPEMTVVRFGVTVIADDNWKSCDLEPKLFANANYCCDEFKRRGSMKS